jgi:hypothetical protein
MTSFKSGQYYTIKTSFVTLINGLLNSLFHLKHHPTEINNFSDEDYSYCYQNFDFLY